MSPPTRLGLCASSSAGPSAARARIRSRKPGANRSTCASIRSRHVRASSRSGRGSRPRRSASPPARAWGRRGSAARAARRAARRSRPRQGARSERGDLLERAAEMDGRRLRALRRPPGDRPVERPVELEDARPVAEAARAGGGSATAAPRRRARASWRGVTSSRIGSRAAELGERVDAAAGLDLAAERAEVARRARRRAAASRRGRAASRPRGRACRARARTPRSAARRAAASSARASPANRPRARVPAEAQRAQATVAGSSGAGAEARQRERMAREPERRRGARRSVAGRGRAAARSACGSGVASSPSVAAVSSTERSEQRRASRRRRDARARPAAATHSTRARSSGSVRKNGEATRERMDRRADVVREARQRQLRRAQPPPTVSSASSTRTDTPGPREGDRRGQPVRPRADDDRLDVSHGARLSLAKRCGDGVNRRSGSAHEWRTLPARFHCRRLSTQTDVRLGRRYRRRTRRASDCRVASQNLSSFLWPPSVRPISVSGS